MNIYGNVMEQLRPVGPGVQMPSTPRQTDAPVQPVAPASPVDARSDSVEISDRGRSLIALAETDPDRVAELRRKVYEGAYNSLDLVDQVARRMLNSGDL
jgi:anti-sigma28 factor (negative regulator of flagellin synthesis)